MQADRFVVWISCVGIAYVAITIVMDMFFGVHKRDMLS